MQRKCVLKEPNSLPRARVCVPSVWFYVEASEFEKVLTMLRLLGLCTLSVVWYYLKKKKAVFRKVRLSGQRIRGETHFICILTYFQSQDELRDRFI